MDEALLTNAIKGVVAGAIGVWVMDRVDWFAYRHESEEARKQTTAARPEGLDPAHVLANQAAGMAGRELSPQQPHPLGVATHYGLGVGPGAIYGAVRDQFPAVTSGRGTLFGLSLFLLQDEGINAITGLSGKPSDYPWQAHGRGLLAHLVFGVVTDSVLRLLDGSKSSPKRHY
jgi:hypothetical protein